MSEQTREMNQRLLLGAAPAGDERAFRKLVELVRADAATIAPAHLLTGDLLTGDGLQDLPQLSRRRSNRLG